MSSPVGICPEGTESLLGTVDEVNLSERVETLLGGMDEGLLMALGNNDIDSICEMLQEPFEDLERRIVVSSMVQDAVAKGFLKALEEESRKQLADKDIEISQLRDSLKEKDAAVLDLRKVLEIREKEFSAPGPGDNAKRSKQVWEFLHESQQKWRESEARVEEKEKELTKLAVSMAEMASILDNESKRVAVLNKQLNDLREQDSTKMNQISVLQEEIERLKQEHISSHARLKRQGRLKELKFEEAVMQLQAENKKQRLEIEHLVADRDSLCKAFEERGTAMRALESNLVEKSRACEDLEAQLTVTTEEVNSLSMVVHNTIRLYEARVKEERLLQETEREAFTILLENWMVQTRSELAQWAEQSEPLRFQLETPTVLELQLQPEDGGGDPAALTDDTPSKDDSLQDKDRENEASASPGILPEEFSWKLETEALILQLVLEGWLKEVTYNVTLELPLKDEEIIDRERELESLQNAVEELKSNCATLMSIWFRGQSDPRGESAAQLLHEMKGEGRSLMDHTEPPKAREGSGRQDENTVPGLDLQEELAGQQVRHECELEIISEVLKQKYQAPVDISLDSKPTTDKTTSNLDVHSGTAKTSEAEDLNDDLKASTSSLEQLESQLGSFLQLEAFKLERIKSGCSTSIAKCEFKLDNLMESLAMQVNEMKTKISFVQEAIQQQEWKHNIEGEILVLVLLDAVEEMHRKVEKTGVTQRVQNILMKPSTGDFFLESKSPLDVLLSPKAVGHHLDSGDECTKLSPSKSLDFQSGIQDKNKLLLLLKRDNEELRKEKANLELKLDARTEELYSLKRLFWKEKETWISKLSQPQRKEVEALSRCSSPSLEEELKRLEAAKFDSLILKLREEWQNERAVLLEANVQKEMEIKYMAAELAGLVESSSSSSARVARLLAQIEELEKEKKVLSLARNNQESLLLMFKQEWQADKEQMAKELAMVVEKEKGHITTEARLLAHIAELETERETLILEKLGQESFLSNSRQEWQIEKEGLLDKLLEKDRFAEDLRSQLAALSEKENSLVKRIAQLETERDWLITGRRHKDPSATSLLEQREMDLALAIKEREEEEKRRKVLEIQLQTLRLELKCLQGLNEEVAYLKGKLESVPRQLELKFAEQISQSVKASHEFEHRATYKLQERIGSLDGIKEKCRCLKGHFKSYATRESHYKQKLAKELSNLQKAEAEVDLLGDEVDSLLNVLEKVHVALHQYAPIFQHYPKMMELTKLVMQEIQLRIDPRYGM